jgi:hypothetical protein
VHLTVAAVQDDALRGAALVRPDGVVAWRTTEAPAHAGLDVVMADVLASHTAEATTRS